MDKFLPAPLAQLSLAADGTLAIPTEKELSENPPVPLTPELLAYFENIRAEFSLNAKIRRAWCASEGASHHGVRPGGAGHWYLVIGSW